jgi:hypothetical protein
MSEYYTTEQLKDRGWTSSMVKAHLGKPDDQRSNPNGPLKKPVKLYRIERVHAAEDGPARSEIEKLEEAVELAKRALRLKKNATTETR